MNSKKKILITEKQFKLIYENEQYSEWDYLDAFFVLFRNWIKANVGEEELNKPMSFLLKKYQGRFMRWVSNTELDDDDDDDGIKISRWNINRIVQDATKRGLYTLPTLRKSEKFTEKYEKYLKTFLENLALPPYVTVDLREDTPQNIEGTLRIDFKPWIRDPERRSLNPSTIGKKLRDYLSNYMGVEFGNPLHGLTELNLNHSVVDGFEEWKKDDYMKKIRPEIKNLEGGRSIKSIKLEQTGNGLTMKITFNYISGYSTRSAVVNKIRDLLQEMGYGPNIRVES